jgi:Kef-type K+ transport system membrane component KefB
MEKYISDISVIVVFSAVLAWLAILLKQPIIIGYIVCGAVAGPWGLKLVKDVNFIGSVSQLGIILLLFHAGLVLHPQRLKQLFKQTSIIIFGQSLLVWAGISLIILAFGAGFKSSLLIGMTMVFSSTILVIKLMPTTTLHHQRMGAYAIAILIAEDIIAVGILMLVSGTGHPLLLLAKGLVLGGAALAFEHFLLRRLMRRVQHYHEVLFLMALGWGLGLALAAHLIGFSPEAAAFIAGVALAREPLALFLSEGLKQFRDFFLVFFFFVLGAQFNFGQAGGIIIPALILSLAVMGIKNISYQLLFRLVGETKAFSQEAGIRLSQSSEFALIIAAALYGLGHIDMQAWQLIQIVTVITMIASSYLVVFRYPTPLGAEGLQKV